MARTMDISFAGLVAMLAVLVVLLPSVLAADITYCSSQNTGGSSDALYWTWQSNGWCSDQCRTKGTAFAIVLTNNCWCSDYIPEDQTNTGDCSDVCPGFPTEKCGNKDQKLYGYIQIGQPSGTAGGSQSTSISVSKPLSSFSAKSASEPTASAVSTTLMTTASGEESSAAPAHTPFTSIRVVTVSGGTRTETVVNQPNTTGGAESSQKQKKSTPVGAIVGGVLGGLALLGLIVGAVLFFLWKKRKDQRKEDDIDGQGGVQRNVSTMSKAGLLHGEKHYPPKIATTFQSSKRNSRMDLDNTSISPISGSDRRSSRPVVFDQRLNPSAIMVLDNGSRGSFASLDDSRDYGRALGVRNPDPPRESVDVRSLDPRT